MDKKKYFVNVGTHEISQIPVADNNDFTIYATEDEVFLLREKLTEMHNADMGSFWRAHAPFDQYHDDKPNDEYDDGIVSAYHMIHDLGDDKTREHIEQMGIINFE